MRILKELRANARTSFTEIGRRIGLTAPAVAERVHRMEEDGVITGYHAAVDPHKLGLPITVFIQVVSKNGQCAPISEFALRQSGVTECCHITGEKDVLIKASLDSMETVEALVNRLTQYGNVTTSIVLSSWTNNPPAE
jgi:Lrp/AsnC family leucine-responsive transcriptional regulator